MTDITENGKYYIPSIEEFHVGFEYEEFFDDKWIKNIVDKNFYSEYREESDFQNIFDELSPRRIIVRVKYLDHDDIIDCGWNENSDPQNIGYGIITKEKHFVIRHFNGSTLNQILKVSIDKNYQQIFIGTILNKSELKFIMKRLEI